MLSRLWKPPCLGAGEWTGVSRHRHASPSYLAVIFFVDIQLSGLWSVCDFLRETDVSDLSSGIPELASLVDLGRKGNRSRVVVLVDVAWQHVPLREEDIWEES